MSLWTSLRCSLPSPGGLGVLCRVVAGGCLVAMAWWSSAASALPPTRTARSTQILRLDCSSLLGRLEITLFGNGTVRVREGPRGEEEMYLGELGRDEFDAYLNRLKERDLSESEHEVRGVEGEWVEECLLELELPGEDPRGFRFRRYDSLSMAIHRTVAIAVELGEKVERRPQSATLPGGYEPRVGDRLRRVDGRVFEVAAFTSNDEGVELRGEDQPLTVVVRVEDLRLQFVALLSRW